MRLTVLCLLAFAGATCALQFPSIFSPPSAPGAGSSAEDKSPEHNHSGHDSSSSEDSSNQNSGSGSEEHHDTARIAKELAERLVNDVWNINQGFGSVALLPLKIGEALFSTLHKEISNFAGKVLHPENLADPAVLKLIMELTQSVAGDIEKAARNIGSLLLEPEIFKAHLIESIAGDAEQWLKKAKDQLSGQSSRPKKQGA